jgi:hypothetical protein
MYILIMFYQENLKLIKEAIKDNYSFVEITPIKEIEKTIPKREFNKDIIRGQDLIDEALNPYNDTIIITEFKLTYKGLDLFIYMNNGFFSSKKDLSKVEVFAVSSFLDDKISLKQDSGIIQLNNLLLPFFLQTNSAIKIKDNFKLMKKLIEDNSGLILKEPKYKLSSHITRSVDNKVKLSSLSKEYTVKHKNRDYTIILVSENNKDLYKCSFFQNNKGKPFVKSFTITDKKDLNDSFTNIILQAQEIGSIPKVNLFHNKSNDPETKDIKDLNLMKNKYSN